MMFFNVLGILTEGFYSLTSGIYYFLGNLYTFIVDLATTNFINSSVIEEFVRTIYVLAGVFMLFRVAVSFLNSLIDPDKFTDKNEGASKLLTRLIIVVILMIALTPGSFVYRFLDRVQNAVIGDDGLIVNIVGKAELNVSSAINKYIDDVNPFTDTYKNANAAGSNRNNNNSNECDYSSVVIEDGNNYYHMNIYYGNDCASKYSGLKKITGKSNTFYKFLKSSDSDNAVNYVLPTNVSSVSVSSDYNVYTKKGGKIYVSEPQEVKINNGVMTLYNEVGDCTGYGCLDSAGSLAALEIGKDNGYRDGKNNYRLDSGGLFAQTVLSTMTSCPDIDDQTSEECTKDIKGNILVDENQVISDIDDEKLSISWLIAIIVGIVIIIYLAVLCIEVVVRSLKLMLLQMISPIAIISYVSPKDKILGQWAKMYASTYLDLFIKLFAIKLGAELISAISFSGSVIKDLILILGSLVFMKVIPTMISKIFGIDIASGTFKDSLSMLKAGVGATAGAALAAGAGIIGGAVAGGAVQGGKLKKFVFGAGNALKSGAAGFVGGAASGYGGNVLGGAKKRTTKDQQHRIANASGASFFGTQKSKAMQALGLDDDYITAKNNKAANEIVKSSMSNIEEQALGVANKEAGNGSRIAEFVKLRNATDIFNRVNNNEKVRRYSANEVSQAKFEAQQLSRDLETIKNGGIVYKSNGQVMSLDECKAQLDDNQAIVANEFWDKSTAEVNYFKAQKVAREKVINDVYNFQQTNDKSSFDGYVKLVENGEVNYNDYNKVNEAIGNSQEAAKAAGIKDFMETVKDTDGKVVGYKYNKDRKDEAEANVTRFDKQMKQSEANHNAALSQK